MTKFFARALSKLYKMGGDVLGKVDLREKRRKRIRKKINGTSERPRFSVFKSNKYIYAQIIDDLKGHTLVSASSHEKELDGKNVNCEISKQVGMLIAKRAVEKGISIVSFDRCGYKYHGNIKALADGARECGLQF